MKRLSLLVLLALLLAAAPGRAQDAPPIGGVYEIGIGTTDAVPLIRYWEQFGYRVGPIDTLGPATAERLYDVRSGLRSVRLLHQNTDHGLIRLMVWDELTNDGLGIQTMKAEGTRWGTTLTDDVLRLANHAEAAQAAGQPIRYVPPQWSQIYETGEEAPFLKPMPGVREMMVLRPRTRHVLYERFNYTIPHYGDVNEDALFRTSQVTHVGMVIRNDDKVALRFYDEVLGLLRARDDNTVTYDEAKASRRIFDLEPGEQYTTTDFDDPRSSSTDFEKMRSGRLKIIRFPEATEMPTVYDRARPGALGMSLYTYRVRDLDAYRERVRTSGATDMTPIVENEFGERSFSFVAPDGYFWTLLER
jgi:uncharacterized glyoxalase superfamily protein PhnB